MLDARRGEKWGWTFGFLGGSLWMFVAALSEFAGGHWEIGLFALCSGCFVVDLVIVLAPWKHPSTAYWKLLLPSLTVMIVCVAFLLTRGGRVFTAEVWSTLFMVFVSLFGLLPGMGWRRWEDREPKKTVSASASEP